MGLEPHHDRDVARALEVERARPRPVLLEHGDADAGCITESERDLPSDSARAHDHDRAFPLDLLSGQPLELVEIVRGAVVEQTFAAQREAVWQAITEPGQMCQWFFEPIFSRESGERGWDFFICQKLKAFLKGNAQER